MDPQGIPPEITLRLAQKPRAFDPLDGLIWEDHRMAQNCVESQLDLASDDGSRPWPQIQGEVQWILNTLGPGRGRRVLDLGCGVGHHLAGLARAGWRVQGWDLNPLAVEQAQKIFRDQDLPGDFFQGNFLSQDWPGDQDLILCLYGTLGTLSPDQEARLRSQVLGALVPGGSFLADVFTHTYAQALRKKLPREAWTSVPGTGVWARGPHLVLTRQWDYPEIKTFAQVYSILDAQGLRQIPFWYRPHNSRDLAPWKPKSLHQGLGPQPWTRRGDWIGFWMQKP